MKFTPESLQYYVQSKIVLDGLVSSNARRYLNPERNTRNFEFALDHADNDSRELIEGVLPRLSQSLGNINELINDRESLLQNVHHLPFDLLVAVTTGRAAIAKILREQRLLRRS